MKEEVILAAIIPIVMKGNEEILKCGGSFESTFGCNMYEYAAKLAKEFINAYNNYKEPKSKQRNIKRRWFF